MANLKTVILKSGRGRLYERLLLSSFDWESVGVLDKWSITTGGRTWRFDCIHLDFVLPNPPSDALKSPF